MFGVTTLVHLQRHGLQLLRTEQILLQLKPLRCYTEYLHIRKTKALLTKLAYTKNI